MLGVVHQPEVRLEMSNPEQMSDPEQKNAAEVQIRRILQQRMETES
jgi:hypothetical protein